MKTFDVSGNIRNEIYSNSIILDREPPFKPIVAGGTNIFTNVIPTISWENDINYFKYSWLIMSEEDFKKLDTLYKELGEVENYILTADDWKCVFSTQGFDKSKVNEKVLKLSEEIQFKKNESLDENSITLNKTIKKNGISNDGNYVFVLTGFDQNGNWAEEYEYQFITYDTEAPDVTKMKFTRPLYTITENRRPEWIWEVPNDVVRCEYSLEKNGYADGSTFGKIENKVETDTAEFKFKPQFNLTSGNYKLVVNCYDSSGNHVQINKSITIETESSSLESTFEDIMLEGQSNRIRIKRNKYSNSYVIIDIDIDKNSILSYKESEKEGYNIYELGKTELRLDKEYEFNIISYIIQ
ncbi:hypothetical protein [uncultured Cetobacterium sp.]|uniref:hypothetical protein n=1 Tax=uncultured Cetobacterium sp. TaxID=527638 RepID=UPI0026312CDE|nr:hypothetical protein [uncultured Cetobacterium sp.]